MPKPDKSGIQAKAPMQYYCVECGHKIDGEPYEMSMGGYEDSVDAVYFCGKKCWDGSEEFNTANWPEPGGS